MIPCLLPVWAPNKTKVCMAVAVNYTSCISWLLVLNSRAGRRVREERGGGGKGEEAREERGEGERGGRGKVRGVERERGGAETAPQLRASLMDTTLVFTHHCYKP